MGVAVRFSERFMKVTYTKFLTTDEVRSDNWIFRLHYSISPVFVLLFAFISTIMAWYRPIHCIFSTPCIGSNWNQELQNYVTVTKDTMDLNSDFCNYERSWYANNLVEDYCWTNREVLHTYSWMNNGTETVNLFPGNPNSTGYNAKSPIYYQWVSAILIFQFILFRLPIVIWSIVENGKMKSLCGDCISFLLESTERIRYKITLSDYLVERLNSPSSRRYSSVYVFCELLNLVCTLIQILVLDLMTDHAFSRLGFKVFTLNLIPRQDRVDLIASIFPTRVQCNFTDFGQGSGKVQDGICILPQNFFNEAYFILMWYYLLFLTTLNCALLTYRVAIIFSLSIRRHLLNLVSPFSSPNIIRRIVENCDFGDWFILYRLGQNIVGPLYHEIILEYGERMVIRETKKI